MRLVTLIGIILGIVLTGLAVSAELPRANFVDGGFNSGEIVLYDATMSSQAFASNEPITGLLEDFVFSLGSGSNRGEVLAAWHRGVDAWIRTSGQQPVPIDTSAANIKDPTQPTHVESVGIADGCVFMTLQADDGGLAARRVFKIDTATGQPQLVSSAASVNGSPRVISSQCRAAWVHDPNDDTTGGSLPFELQYFDGIRTITLDSGPLEALELALKEDVLVYIKRVEGHDQVLRRDLSNLAAPARVLSSTGLEKMDPQIHDLHVVWGERVESADARVDITAYGDVRSLQDPSGTVVYPFEPGESQVAFAHDPLVQYWAAAPLGAAPVQAQACDAPVVSVLNQFDADNFSCSDVTGTLFISDNGNGGITDLSGLSILASVGGDLVIQDNAALASLTGLESLSSVGGNVEIGNLLFGGNDALASLTGLDGLASVGGDLGVVDNAALVSLAGLEGLVSLGGGLSVEDNPALASLAALSGLAPLLDGSLIIEDNATLASLTGVDNVTSIGGNLVIRRNASLASMSGLESLASIDNGGGIADNPSLTSLAGLEHLTSVGGSLVMRENPALASLTGLAALTTVGGDLWVDDADALVSLAGLENLASTGGLALTNNEALASLAGLDNLADSQSLVVIGNPALTSLAGAGNVTSLVRLVVSDNDALPSFAGLENLASLGWLEVESNNTLASFAGLENVTSLDQYLVIDFNPALVSLAGLESITSVGTFVQIFGNDGLVSLSGLNGLTSVGIQFGVSSNPALQSLAGLENLTSVGVDLLVFVNDSLVDCTCGLTGLISGSPPAFTGVGGQVQISDNEPAGLCTSPSVVLDVPLSSCTTTNAPPVADAGADQTVQCAGSGGTEVTLDGSGSSDPDGDALTYSWAIDGEEIATGVSPTVSLGQGTHTIVLTVDDGNGETATDEVEISVADTTAPVLMTVDAEPLVLWPPNHMYHTVSLGDLGLTASDACDSSLDVGSVVIASVASDEPENALGDGDTTDDIWLGDGDTTAEMVLDDCRTVRLRAERQGGLDGRVYTLTLAIADASGNVGTATYEVQVPHDVDSTAVGGPLAFSVEGCLR